jgi:hypothetical protein
MLDLVGDCLLMTTPVTVIVPTRQTNHVNTATETDKLSDPLPVAADALLGSRTGTGTRTAGYTRVRIRVLFVFDPWRSAILLVAGDKTGQ